MYSNVYEGSTPQNGDGTSDTLIANAINNYLGYNDIGPSKLKSPDPGQLHAMVVEDTWYYHEPVIENVSTGSLPNWTGPHKVVHDYEHFDVLYGDNDNNGGELNLAEEYDPHQLGYNTNWDPYGTFTYPAADFSAAIGNSPDKDIVW